MVKIIIPKSLSALQNKEDKKPCKTNLTTVFATIFGYTDAHLAHWNKYGPKLFDYFLYQSEKCPTTGTMHIHFVGHSKKEHNVNYYQDNFFVNNCKIESVRKMPASILYCSKKDTHDGGIRYNYNVYHIDLNHKNHIHKFDWDLTNSDEERTKYTDMMDKTHKARSKGQGSRSDINDLMTYLEGCTSYAHALKMAIALKDYTMLKDLDKYESMVTKYFNNRPRPEKQWPHKEQFLWQSKLIKIIESPADDRTINFIVDFKGKSGKSTLSNYLLTNYNAFSAFGKEAEVYYLYSGETIILCDSPRDRNDYINYSTLEKLKDGNITSTKYQPVKKYRDEQAHIIVFMNQWPDIKALSRDRYNIYCIDPTTKDLERVKYLDINHRCNKKYYDQSKQDDSFSEDEDSYEDEVVLF